MESARLNKTVVKAQNGNQDALQELYLDSYKSVYYFALKVLRNPDDAEDVTQEVFITVHQHIADLKCMR